MVVLCFFLVLTGVPIVPLMSFLWFCCVSDGLLQGFLLVFLRFVSYGFLTVFNCLHKTFLMVCLKFSHCFIKICSYGVLKVFLWFSIVVLVVSLRLF